jgi:hypothetical protein
MDTVLDGAVFADTSRMNGVGLWGYARETGEVQPLQRLEEESCVGCPECGEEEPFLPEELEGSEYVYVWDAAEGLIAAGTASRSTIGLLRQWWAPMACGTQRRSQRPPKSRQPC